MNYDGLPEKGQGLTPRLDLATPQGHIASASPEWIRSLDRLFGNLRQVTDRDSEEISTFRMIGLNLVTARRGLRILGGT